MTATNPTATNPTVITDVATIKALIQTAVKEALAAQKAELKPAWLSVEDYAKETGQTKAAVYKQLKRGMLKRKPDTGRRVFILSQKAA